MSIIDDVKEVYQIAKKFDNQEFLEKVVDLREEIFDLRNENLSLKEELSEQKKALEIETELVRDGNCYYKKNDLEEKLHPYCMTCWDADKKLISLVRSTDKCGTRVRCDFCNKR